MTKSILFGVLAFFAVSAMSVQSVDAQNPVKKPATEKKVEKKAETATAADTKAVKKDDCCASKAVSAEKKTDDCCADKKVESGEKKVGVERKNHAEKNVSFDSKKVKKHNFQKPRQIKGKEAQKAERTVKDIK